MSQKPGDSAEQRAAERWLVERFSASIGSQLSSRPIATRTGAVIQLDGWSDHPPVLCEAWAHVGAAKPAQKYKVMQDAIRLLFVQDLFGASFRKVLLFGDEVARRSAAGGGWRSEILKHFSIETQVFGFPPNMRKDVELAQRRQSA